MSINYPKFFYFYWSFPEKEAELKEAESEAPKKGKGFVESIRDWVRPATEKTQGIEFQYYQLILQVVNL
jgi:hypothetical protein